MQQGEWHRLSAQIPAGSLVLSELLQRRSIVRPLPLRSFKLQRFLVLHRPLMLPVCFNAV